MILLDDGHRFMLVVDFSPGVLRKPDIHGLDLAGPPLRNPALCAAALIDGRHGPPHGGVGPDDQADGDGHNAKTGTSTAAPPGTASSPMLSNPCGVPAPWRALSRRAAPPTRA